MTDKGRQNGDGTAVLGLGEEGADTSSSSSSDTSSDTDSDNESDAAAGQQQEDIGSDAPSDGEKPSAAAGVEYQTDEDLQSQQCNEEAPIRRPRNPSEPTPDEKERHWATHLPYRSWCPVCVKARGREDPHRAHDKRVEDNAMPRISMDYAEVGSESTNDNARKLLVGRDRHSKYTFCHLVKCKGVGDELIVSKVLQSIRETGNTKIILKTDGEPAIIQLQERIIAEREHKTIPQNPAAHDPQSNGEAERAVQEIKAQLRAIKLGLEARIEREVPVNCAALEWMIPHAAHTINRFLVGADGRTAHYRLYLKNFGGKTFEFGEQVLAKPKRKIKQVRRRTLDARFREATWVGYSGRSGEHVVVLPGGGPAIKVRTVKSRPPSERWNEKAIGEVVATPDAPNPKDPNQKAPKSEMETHGLDFGTAGGQNLPRQRVRPEPDMKRDFRITDKLLLEYGFTPGCRGCEAKLTGGAARMHSDACRSRIEDAIRASGPGADVLERRDARLRRGESSKVEHVERGKRDNDQVQAAAEDTKPETNGREDAGGDHHAETRDAEQNAGATNEQNDEDHIEVDYAQQDASKRKANPDEEAGRKKQRIAVLTRRSKIEDSVKQALTTLLREGNQAVGALCNREAVTVMVDELDKACTRKIMKRLASDGLHGAPHDEEGVADEVAEVSSPPRLTEAARQLGYRDGFTLDLTTRDADGNQWNLACPIQQRKALRLQEESQPWLLMACPPCSMFPPLQHLTLHKHD